MGGGLCGACLWEEVEGPIGKMLAQLRYGEWKPRGPFTFTSREGAVVDILRHVP